MENCVDYTFSLCMPTQISVNGKELPRATQPFYFAVNKPKGYLCANVPNKEGTTKLVVDLFEVSQIARNGDLCAVPAKKGFWQCHVRPRIQLSDSTKVHVSKGEA